MSKNSNDHQGFDRNALRQIMNLGNLGFNLEKNNAKEIEEFISVIEFAIKNSGEGMSDVNDRLGQSKFYVKAGEKLQEDIQGMLAGIVFEAINKDEAQELIHVLRHMQNWEITDLQKEVQKIEKANTEKKENIVSNNLKDMTEMVVKLMQTGYMRLDIAYMISAVNTSNEFNPLALLPPEKKNLTPSLDLEIRNNIVDLAIFVKGNPERLENILNQAVEKIAKLPKTSIKDRIKTLNKLGLKGEFKPLIPRFEPSDTKPILTRRGALHGDKKTDDFVKPAPDAEKTPRKPNRNL